MISFGSIAKCISGGASGRKTALRSSVLGALGVAALIAATPIAEAQTLRIPHDVGMGGAENIDPISPNRFAETNLIRA